MDISKADLRRSLFGESTKSKGDLSAGTDFLKQLEILFGFPFSEEIQQYLTFHQTHIAARGIGAFFPMEINLPETNGENSFLWLLSRSRLDLYVQLFAGTLLIGTDGEGQQYFISLESKSSEVFLFNSGAMDFEFLSDSLVALVKINGLYNELIQFVDKQKISIESLIDGNLKDKPALSPFQHDLKALTGQINLDESSDVYSNYHEVFNGLSNVELIAKSVTTTKKKYDRAIWIMQLLAHTFDTPTTTEPAPIMGKEDIKDPSDALYWLWRHYFMGADNALKNLCKRCKEHKAKLVRDAAILIEDLLEKPNSLSELNYLRLQRNLILEKNSTVINTRLDASFLKPEKQDNPNIASYKKTLLGNKNDSSSWDNLAYYYGVLGDWKKAQYASEMSLTHSPHSYYGWMQLGIAFHQQKQYDQALKSYDQALCFSSHQDLWTNKIFALLEAQKLQEVGNHLMHYPAKIKINSKAANDFVNRFEKGEITMENGEEYLNKIIRNGTL